MKPRPLIALAIILTAVLACSRPGAIAPKPSAPVNAYTPPAPLFTAVTLENVTLSIPNGMGTGATANKTDNVELPFINPSNGPMPQHIVFQVNGYALPRDATIMIFKASEYAAYDEMTQKIVTSLKSQPYQAGQPVAEELTLSQFYAQPAPLTFQNGQGLRYITEILTGIAPITNDDVFYYYQGLTNDSAYFVSAKLPISIGFLPANSKTDTPTPVNGIPFPGFTNPNATTDDFKAYFTAVKDRLNVSSPDTFTPSLAELDKMIQSIKISPQ